MKYHTAIIGGGPAGMMAAGRAGEIEPGVVLIEKNNRLGTKLLISGGGRCNITNKTENIKELVAKFGTNGKFLFSAFHQFGPEQVIEFFENRGVKTKIEDSGRVFPVSNKSQDVLKVLTNYLKESKVEVKLNSEVKKIIKQDNLIKKIVLTNGEEILSDRFIICTGGKSYPELGATGDGYLWLKQLGHTITETYPALTQINIQEKIVKKLEGLSLKNIKITLLKNNKIITSQTGDAIFTANGLSGPTALTLSREVNKEKNVKIGLQIDFFPEMAIKQLDAKLQQIFKNANNKLLRNSLDILLPARLIPVIIELTGVDPEKQVNVVTKQERLKILQLLKEFKLTTIRSTDYRQAMVTAGGVNLSEIDPQTMKSKIIDNLYLAGEILDLDAPTGGYNLQMCWSTGWLAGNNK